MVSKNTPILVTGANGFVGKNLVLQLKNLGYTDILEYDISTPEDMLCEYAKRAGFVFHLAGVNRPKDNAEFYTGNSDLTVRLTSLLQQCGNACSILLSSSTQAELDNDYGKSKAAAEEAVFAYSRKANVPCYIYRLPGVFGKWCRPFYNSVVATFCHNIARDLPIEIRDENYSFPLCYIDDVVRCFITCMETGTAMRDKSVLGICRPDKIYEVTLGRLAATLKSFAESRKNLSVADMSDEFTKKLYSTYLSYLPADRFAYPLNMHCDERGSFTEFLRTETCGQVSVNISHPGVVKGNHWHHTKNEKFLVVRGKGVIRFRRVDSDEVIEYPVSGDELCVVDIPTGYIHNIENTGSEDMVTVMWANEPFDPQNPDTYYSKI